MKRKASVIITIIFCSIICQSQEIKNHEIVNRNLKNDNVPIVSNKFPVLSEKFSEIGMSPFRKNELGYFYESETLFQDSHSYFDSDSSYLAVPEMTFIPTWKNAGFVVAGSISSYSGLMDIHKGSVGFIQNFGNLTVYAGGEVNKYGYFNGLHTQYGINGTIQYAVSTKLSINGYATYYFGRNPMMSNGMPIPPSIMGYYGFSTFGATLNYQFNETFGLIVGGEAVQQFGTNRYRFEPVVTPTVKIGRVKIGIPVGQIVYDLIRSNVERSRSRRILESSSSVTRK